MKKVIAFCMSTMIFLFSIANAQKIETVDGVRIVHNEKPQWRDNPKLSIEFVKQIGVFEGPDENYMFYKPSHITKDTDGNIYILDSGNYRIQKFDPDGKYLATFGRKGQGPSEFLLPQSIDIDSEGNLYVGDALKFVVIVLNSQGKEIRRFRMKEVDSPEFCITENNNLVVSILGGLIVRIQRENLYGLLRIYDNQGILIREFVKLSEYDRRSPLYILGNRINFTIDKKNNVYVSFVHQNRIEKYSDKGILLQRIDRVTEFSETTKVKNTINRFSISMDVDSKGRIWVMSLKRQPTEEEKESAAIPDIAQFEIFDENGVLLGNLPWDHDVNNLSGINPQQSISIRIFDDLLYVIDPATEMVIYEYKIVEK